MNPFSLSACLLRKFATILLCWDFETTIAVLTGANFFFLSELTVI